MDNYKTRVGFFVLPGQENFVEDVLNNPHYVIITKKEQFNAKESTCLIYMEWEDHS